MVRAAVISGGNQTQLDPTEARVVPAGAVTLHLHDVTPADVAGLKLDGRARTVDDLGGTYVTTLDLARSTGFHHLFVPPGHHFWFGTEDAKLRLDGIREMLSYLRGEGLSWSGQFLFSDGGTLLDPHVVYGWLDRHADDAVRAGGEIAQNPARAFAGVDYPTHQGGRRLALKQTISLFKRRGRELLEPMEGGPVTYLGESYAPRTVVARGRVQTFDTPSNRRAVWLLNQIYGLVLRVEGELTNLDERARCRDWKDRIRRATGAGPLAALSAAARVPPPLNPTSVDYADGRYGRLYRVFQAFVGRFGWGGAVHEKPLYAYVGYSDEIYQQFVAHAVADVMGLAKAPATAGASRPRFQGAEWDMYCGVVPPVGVVSSWRLMSGAPDNFKPDILLHHRPTGAVLIADAKYRNKGDRASESARKEVMAYMSAFGVSTVVILYPPEPAAALAVHSIAGRGQEIVEVTVSPVPGLRAFLDAQWPGILARAATPTAGPVAAGV
jgi:hypothetical protein